MAYPETLPPQTQDQQPGQEHQMSPQPEIIKQSYKGSQKLTGKVALITGGDSGIGRSVAVHFAREGADVAIVYLEENEDAQRTRQLVEAEQRQCLLISGDLKDRIFCEEAVSRTLEKFGHLEILVNNAAVQFPQEAFKDIRPEDLQETFQTNVFAMFYVTQQALRHFKEDARIINTTSVTAYRGSHHLVDYASTKGAIVSFTRSLSKNLAPRKILVNAVAPGPIWTPLIPSSFSEKEVSGFGQDTPLGRVGQPSEVAPAYVFLASPDSTYMTGQVLHVNGGEVVGG